MSVPRGIANNNPCNIEYSPANAWQGRMPPAQRTGAQVFERRFEVFIAPEYGIRAAAVLITSYYDRYGRVTVHDVIHRWAPSSENDTASYVSAVARRMGVMPNEVLDLHDYATMKSMVTAMIWQENGVQPYPDALLDLGLGMAGFVRPATSIARDPAVVGSAVATAGGVASAALQGVDSVRYALLPFADLRWVQGVAIGLAIVGAVLAVISTVRTRPRML